jgi:hypothetical protein
MARIKITAPDGKSYMLTVPDGMTPEDAVNEFERDVLKVNLDTSKPSLPTADVQKAAQGWAGKTPDLPGYAGAGDIAKSAGIGLVQGGLGLASIPGLIESGGRTVANWAGADVDPDNKVFPTYGRLKKLAETVGGDFYEPQSVAGEYARTLGEFAPGMVGGPGSLAAKGVSTGAAAIASETAGQATKGTDYEPWARVGAGLAGALVPSVAARAAAPIKQAGEAGKERARLAAILDAEGVPMTAGQRTGSKGLKWAESVAGDIPFNGGKAAAIQESQGEAFTRAALKRIGSDADRATPDVMEAARKRIGAAFDDFAKGREVRFDGALASKLDDVITKYKNGIPESMHVKDVFNKFDDFAPAIAALKKGETPIITGEQFTRWRSGLTDAIRDTNNNETRTALSGYLNALDDALERSAEPAAREAIKEARRQYKHLITLEKTAAGASEDAAQGLLSPQALANRVTATDAGKRAYVQGKGDLADLARAGRGLLKPLPQSGTGPRIAAQVGLQTLGALGGYNEGGLPGALAPMAGQALGARLLMSKPVQRYLSNALRGQQYMAGKQGAPKAGVKGTIADVLADEEWQPLTHRSKYRTD